MKLVNLVSILSILLLLRGEPMPEKIHQEWRVPRDFPTIQAAIDAAHEGDTILIAPGVYREHLVISKSVTLQGAGPTETILEGKSSEFELFWEEEPVDLSQGPFFVPSIAIMGTRKPEIAPPATVVQAKQVQIRSLQIRPQGFQVEHPPLKYPPFVPRPLRAGVLLEREAETLLEQVIIRHAHYGVFVRRGASLVLRQSTLHNWRIGIEIWGTAVVDDSSIHNEDIYEYESSEKAIVVNGEGRAILKRNRISIFHVSHEITQAHRFGDFHDGGVLVEGGELTLESNQIVGDLHYGVSLSGSGKALIQDNLVIYRGHNRYSKGLAVGSSEATVEGNIILALMPHGAGIKINPRAQATVRRNRISQNGIGIEVVGATAHLVENDVYANKIGIQLTHHEKDGQVELVRNRVSQNEVCGITAQSSRYSAGEEVYEIFTGQLKGAENEVWGNLGADLCPPDYPWSPGFRK